MPDQNELQKATSIYESMANEPVVYGGAQNQDPNMPIIKRMFTSPSTQQASGGMDTWRYGSPNDVRQSRYGGGSSGGATATAAPQPQQRPYKPVEFKAPSNLKMPEYKPPERDESQEKGFRREYMGPGMAQIRRSTQEAIISSKSFDNPNARAMFIRDALKGVGEGVEKVAGGAQREARAESGRRHSEDITNYVNQWNAKAQEATAKYDSEWKTAMMQFQEQQYAARQATDPNVSATAGPTGSGQSGSVSGTAAGDLIQSYRTIGR